MVCNPNNPTGAVLTAEEMDAVVRAARRRNAWIVSDEIYRGAEVPGQETTPTFWGRYNRVVVTSGLSKAFALPGLRVGWIVAPARLIQEIWKRHDYTTLTPGMLSDRLAARVLEPAVRERVLLRTRAIIRRNLPRLEEWLAAHDEPPRVHAAPRRRDRVRPLPPADRLPGASSTGSGSGGRYSSSPGTSSTAGAAFASASATTSTGRSRGWPS